MSGRNAPRSTNGCQTCRRRKVKCDEARPVCNRCSRLKFGCEWASSGPKGGKNLQFRSLQAEAKSRQLYLASLLEYHDQSSGCDPMVMATTQGMSIMPRASTSRSKLKWKGENRHESDAIALQNQLHPKQQQFLPFVSRAFFLQHSESPQYNDIYASTLLNDHTASIPCANALTLTEVDRKYFAFFPSSSVIYYYMKCWDWSSFGFLYKAPAASSKMIMRMILALAASDMHCQGIFADSDPLAHQAAKYRGRHHYGLAVQELRQLLEQGLSNKRDDRSSENVEMVFCTMFLMITFEWHFGQSVKHLQMHLQGVKCLLLAHPEIFTKKEVTMSIIPTTRESINDGVSFLPAQFLLWTLYIEIASHPMGLNDSLYDTLLESENPDLYPDSLHRCARIWARCLWGNEYPDAQLMDDMQNHRALELLHYSFLMRNKIWQLAQRSPSAAATCTPESLIEELMCIRERYSDMFITAKLSSTRTHSSLLSMFSRSPPVSHRSPLSRTLITIYFAVTSFESQFIAHRLLLQFNTPASTIHRQALTNVLELLYEQYSADPKLLSRQPWEIFLAMIATDDLIHQNWTSERLEEIREMNEAHCWIHQLGSEMRDLQQKKTRIDGGGDGLNSAIGEQVDLTEVLRRRHSTAK